MNEEERDFSDLYHEVHSRGSSIEEAAGLLQKATPEERREMLALMAEQARRLADFIADFARNRRAKESLAP